MARADEARGSGQELTLVLDAFLSLQLLLAVVGVRDVFVGTEEVADSGSA